LPFYLSEQSLSRPWPSSLAVAVVSGGGTHDLRAAIDQRIDLFVTGDAAHETYHAALEAGINVLSGGHYRSEMFGVQAMPGA